MNTISKKTIGLIIGLFIVTGILLYMAVAPTLNKRVTTSKEAMTPSPTSAAQSTLRFNPGTITATAGVPTSVDVELSTGDNNVRAVQVELAYDPLVLSNVSIKGGTFFANPAELIPSTVNAKTGRVSYAIGVPNPKKGTGTVATVTFTPRLTSVAVSGAPTNPSTTEISFVSLSKVAAAGIGSSVLKTSSNLSVTITRIAGVTPVTTTTQPIISPSPAR